MTWSDIQYHANFLLCVNFVNMMSSSHVPLGGLFGCRYDTLRAFSAEHLWTESQ